MTNTKLLDKLKALTRNADSVDGEHVKKLRKVLRKLKVLQIELAVDLVEVEVEVDNDRDHQKIEQDIDVLRLQRRKKIEVYKRLKKERKEKGEPSRK